MESSSVRKVNRDLAADLLRIYAGGTDLAKVSANPSRHSWHVLVDLYLIGCFIYYELDESWFMSDEKFDQLCQVIGRKVKTAKGTLHTSYHPLLKKSALKASTGYHLSGKYPARIQGIASGMVALEKEKAA